VFEVLCDALCRAFSESTNDNNTVTVVVTLYLVVFINKVTLHQAQLVTEIHRRMGIAGSIMAQLDNVWHQQRLSLSTKLRIYTSLVQSVALYGSETWTMRKVDSDRIQSFHMQALRRILGIRLYDKVSNAVVNDKTKLPDLPSLIDDRRHSLFGHICRLPENTPASQALQLSIEAHTGTPPAADWKRPPGHPRRTWLQVEEDIGLSVGAAQIASQDRSMWMMLRPSAGQEQQSV